MLPGRQGAAWVGYGTNDVQWQKERKKQDGGKSRSYRSGHSHALGRNVASPCLHSVVVDFAIFDQGKQDLCAQ